MKKKGNKKMPRPRQEIIDNPIPTSLFMCYAAVLLFVGTGDALLRTLVNVYTIESKDVGTGLSMISCLGLGIFFFPFFFMKWHPYIPLHFREMIFPLVPHTFFVWGKAPIKMECR